MTADDVIAFWTDAGEKQWYVGGEAFDQACRDGFLEAWTAAQHPSWPGFGHGPKAELAALLLLDQLSRNMFRDDPRAFQSDAKARSIAKQAVGAGHHLGIEGPLRQFFFLPFEHSETVSDQHRAVRLFVLHYPEDEKLLHARAHREVIRRFGRFPTRNKTLGRSNTGSEEKFLSHGGYASVLDDLRSKDGMV